VLNRVPAKVYEEAEERRAKEKAVADSIAQAMADSIAQAVADSIIKANTIDSADGDGNPIEIPQDVVDLAESVAECIKKAYSSGSLSAIKDCKI
jgi:phosphoribosylpyrophosphate synthetase